MAKLELLTALEMGILALLLDGKNDCQIAAYFDVSEQLIAKRRGRIRRILTGVGGGNSDAA